MATDASRSVSDSQLELARACVAKVLRDLNRTIGDRPEVVVDDFFGGVRISIDGDYSTPSMSSESTPEAIAEVADYMQAQLTYRLPSIWPVCPTHDSGLHAVVRSGVAAWWCRVGDHRLAAVGELAAPLD